MKKRFWVNVMDIPREFVKIPGHEDYGINAYGEVKSFRRDIILKPDSVNGYFRVTLGNEKLYIHKLVAEAFIPNPYNRPFVIHRDYDLSNNFFLNLQWATMSEVQRAHGRPVFNRYSL